MTFKEKWERLPRWLQVAAYTVLGLAAIGGVGFLGFRLIEMIIGGERMNVFWGVAGAVILIGVVFGGFGSSRHSRKRRRRGETTD